MSDFNEQKNGDKLMRTKEGETREQALDRWWKENGLDHVKARDARKIEYNRQRLEALETLKEVAVRMNRFKEQ